MQESGLRDGQSADRGTKWATHASRNRKEIQDTNANTAKFRRQTNRIKLATHASRNTKEIQGTGYKCKYCKYLEEI